MAKSDSVSNPQLALKLIECAETFAQKCDWRSADELYREAMQVDVSVSTRISYGVFLAERERFFEAISIFTPVLDGRDRSAIGVVCHNLAAIYREVGDFDLARRFQWRATLMSEDMSAEDLLGMANDALLNERHILAESLVRSANELSCSTNEDRDDSDLLATVGLIEAASGSDKQALFALFAAYRQHFAEGDFRRMGTDQLNMSVVFGNLNRYRAERACLLRAIRFFEQAPAPHSCRKARRLFERLDRMRVVRAFDQRRN